MLNNWTKYNFKEYQINRSNLSYFNFFKQNEKRKGEIKNRLTRKEKEVVNTFLKESYLTPSKDN